MPKTKVIVRDNLLKLEKKLNDVILFAKICALQLKFI